MVRGFTKDQIDYFCQATKCTEEVAESYLDVDWPDLDTAVNTYLKRKEDIYSLCLLTGCTREEASFHLARKNWNLNAAFAAMPDNNDAPAREAAPPPPPVTDDAASTYENLMSFLPPAPNKNKKNNKTNKNKKNKNKNKNQNQKKKSSNASGAGGSRNRGGDDDDDDDKGDDEEIQR